MKRNKAMEWKRGEFWTLEYDDSRTPSSGYVSAHWGIGRRFMRKGWRLTHRATGRYAGMYGTVRAAQKAANALDPLVGRVKTLRGARKHKERGKRIIRRFGEL